MTRFGYLLGAMLGFASVASHALTCPAGGTTLFAGQDVTVAVRDATAGATICLSVGTYTASNAVFPANGAFAIGNNVKIIGLGNSPSEVVLQANTGIRDHTVYFVNYQGGKSASGAQLINVTVQGSGGGVQVYDFLTGGATRLTDIKLKDVVITTTGTPTGNGVLVWKSDRIALDNVTITSGYTGINLLLATDSLVTNSTVNSASNLNGAAISVLGGSGHRVVNNTFGQPRLSAGAPYSFSSGAVVFYSTSDNRFEGNTVQGMQNDAVDLTIVDVGAGPQKSLNNYIGKNFIDHSAFPINGLVAGSSGIWSNCASDATWIYGNETRGNAECGVCVWDSRNNMVLGNLGHNNGLVGLFVSGDQGSKDNCTVSAGSFQQKPDRNYILSNSWHYNRNDQVVVRDSDNTVISRNFTSPTSGLGGPSQSCTNPACQAAWSIETDATAGRDTTIGTKLLANTSVNNARGLWAESHTTPTANSVTGIEFYLNRTINAGNSRWVTSIVQNIDRGATLGGNYWTNFVPSGNPSSGQPYSGVLHNPSNNTGNVVDRFPYHSENLGRGYGITIFEPRAGASVGQGTKRTIRWDSVGCAWVDIALAGTTIYGNHSNIGYAVVTIPSAFPTGNAAITMTCKDAAGTTRGGTSTGNPTVSVTSSNLILVSPGRDDTFNNATSTWVAWKNPAFLTPVSIDYSTDAGANWVNLTSVASIAANNPVTSARVTLPALLAQANFMMRVRQGGTLAVCGNNCDETDGVLALRGGSPTFDSLNVFVGRNYIMGQTERLEWSSPVNSRLVTINGTVGATTINVATDLPDRGYFDWVVPDFGAGGTLSLTINYKTNAGEAIGGPATNATSGTMKYATNITFGTIPTIVPGQASPISVSTNSGAPVTLTSSTPSVCTVSESTVTGVANGVCTITGNAGATGAFAAAPPSTISFNVGQSQTITFNMPAYIGAGTTSTLSASASSGLTVTFSSLTPSVCTISGNVLTGTASGTCTVAADQPGNGTFAAAAQVQDTAQSVPPGNIPRLYNISTRMQVLTGGDVMIAGFVVGGTTPKKVVVNVAGPNLANFGIANPLQDPTLTLVRSSDNAVIGANDNWQQQGNPADVAAIQAAGFQPNHPLEPAVIATLPPGAYTAIVQGVNNGTGVGLIGVFEVDHAEVPIINISTRGKVLTGNDVMIAGFIIQGTATQTIVINVAGPHLANFGIANPLQNPTLRIVRSSDQVTIATNDNWQTQTIPGDVAAIQATGFQPNNPNEPAVILTLPPGAYTAIVEGVAGGTGVALVGVFAVQ